METLEYLEAVKRCLSIESDYALAKNLEITRSAVSRYRKHQTTFDDATALKVAKLLKIDPALVLSDMQAQRANSDETRQIWEQIHDRLKHAAAVVFVGVFALFATLPAPVQAAGKSLFCILCKITNRQRKTEITTVNKPLAVNILLWLPFYIFGTYPAGNVRAYV